MNPSLVRSISQEVYRRFPDFAGVHPKVQLQRAPQAKSTTSSATYLLTFQSKASASDKKILSRVVRVVANEQGKILKITTSR